MHKTDDVKQKLIDHMMGMDLQAMSLHDLSGFTLVLTQLALMDKRDAQPWEQVAGMLASAPMMVHGPEEVK